MRKSLKVAAGTFAFAVALGLGASCTASPGDNAGSPATAKPSQAEIEDLVTFKIEDRSSTYIDDFWVVWKIKNNSSEVSDYTWDWDAIDTKSGERVASGTEFEDNVRPGQVVNGDSMTTLDTDENIKINMYKFNRAKSW